MCSARASRVACARLPAACLAWWWGGTTRLARFLPGEGVGKTFWSSKRRHLTSCLALLARYNTWACMLSLCAHDGDDQDDAASNDRAIYASHRIALTAS
mmetsp:Transcript_22672/g.33912  ORF Transcript_22672/g.33912 Transcript_22672/m.33912 type:complete len:99 (+) Transcript_22672:430-726(+)